MSGCNDSYRKRAIPRMDGWLQLGLRNNSIPLKKGMTTSACFKETLLLKIPDHCKRPPEIMTVPLKCMDASAPLK